VERNNLSMLIFYRKQYLLDAPYVMDFVIYMLLMNVSVFNMGAAPSCSCIYFFTYWNYIL